MEENKENRDNIALYHKKKRKKHKIKLAIITTFSIVISLILMGTYFVLNKKHSIKYEETSKVKYGVNLIENEFYEQNYLEKDVDVISSLIKNIDVEFKYDLELTEEIEYEYSYRILAEIGVKEKSKTNLIYKADQELFNKRKQKVTSRKLNISEKIILDYNQYNDQINKLLEQYRLQNTTSELSVNLYLDVINKSTGERINKQNNVMSIVMPLTTKTVEITINENIKDNQGEILIQENEYENTEYFLIAGVFLLIIGLITLTRLIKYISDTRSAEKMYDDELRKILFDYKSYIQKINNEVDYNDYKIIKIDTFKELLGMREELQAPILMYTEEENKKTTFMMINEKLLFINILEARLIRENLIRRSKENKEKSGKRKK